MTNNFEVVDGPDGKPTVMNKSIRVRGYFCDKVVEMVEQEGWEYAASKVCGYCGGYIVDEDETTSIEYTCPCSDEEQQPQEPPAPV